MPGKGSRGTYSRDYIDDHRDGFRYRRAVPTKLRSLIGKAVWCAWLGNKGRREAERRARPIAATHDELIHRFEALTDDERQQIAAATARHGGKPISGLDAWAAGALVDKHIALPLNEALVPYVRADDKMPEAAQLADVKFALHSRERLETLRADVAAAQITAKKLAGHVTSLDGLVVLHTKVTAPKNPQTVEVYKRTVRRFIEAVGDREPAAVTRADVIAFRDHLEGQGETALTIGKMLSALHALLNTALSEGLIDFNPATKIKARPDPNRKYSNDKKPFSPEQIRTILSRLGELKKADDRIVTSLMTYSGARSGELCPLRACDVVNIGGIDAINITDEGERRNVKNKGSLRTVPLHPAIRDEIVTLAARVRQDRGPEARLFSYPYYELKATHARLFQDHFNRWLRNKLMIADGRLTAHSLRHSFIDACRNVEMPEFVSMALTGHVGKSEHAGYGKGVALRVKAQWIARVDPLKG